MRHIAHYIVILSVVIVLLASPLYWMVTPGYVNRAYARPSFPPSIRFSTEERQRLSDAIVGYLRGRVPFDDMATMTTDSGEVALRPEESQHLVDVKRVMDGFFIAHAVALVVGFLAALLLWKYSPHMLVHALRQGIWLTVALIFGVGLAAALNFDLFFTLFHRIFFPEGSWLFFYEDTLIQLYPLPFWIRAVAEIVLAIAAEALVLYGISLWIARRDKAS